MTAEEELDGFIAKFEPALAASVREVVAAMRARLPGAVIPVYDNYNALAIAFGPTDRVKDILFSIAVYPRWVSLFLVGGQALPDPEGMLSGEGATMRHVRLTEGLATFQLPAVQALMEAALDLAGRPLDAGRPQQVIIKSISAKQRPRRP